MPLTIPHACKLAIVCKFALVKRKMRDKNFAKDVTREDMIRGTEELGVDLDEHVRFIVESMKQIAGQIDLNA